LVGKDAFYTTAAAVFSAYKATQRASRPFRQGLEKAIDGTMKERSGEQKFLKIRESGRSSGKYFSAAGSFSEPANNATCSCGLFARFVLQEVVIG